MSNQVIETHGRYDIVQVDHRHKDTITHTTYEVWKRLLGGQYKLIREYETIELARDRCQEAAS